MSNYVQTTFFAPKDLLLSGNPAKLIKGADVDPELNNIATAIATKYDSSSIASAPVLFGAGTAAAPSISFVSATGTGLYKAAANSLGFTANGVSAGSISSSGNWTIAAPASGSAMSVNGFSGSTPLIVSPAGATDYGWEVDAPSASNAAGRFQINAVMQGILGVAGAAGQLISGSALNDLCLRSVNGNLLLASGGAATAALKIASAGNLTVAAPSSGVALFINGLSNNYGLQVTAGATVNQSNGVLIQAGTSSTDTAFLVNNQPNTVTYLWVKGNGQILGGGPTAGLAVDMTPDKGTFTITLTGMSAGTTATASWSRNGNQVTINIPAVTGTSNATTFTCTGLPAAIQPANTQCVTFGGANTGGAGPTNGPISGQISGGTITWFSGGGSSNFGNVASKGFPQGATFSYILN